MGVIVVVMIASVAMHMAVAVVVAVAVVMAVVVFVFVMRFVVMSAAGAQGVKRLVLVTHGGHRSTSRSVSCNSATARFVRPSFTASMIQCSR